MTCGVSHGRLRTFRKMLMINCVSPGQALRTFEEHKDFYHPICRKMVAQDLGLKSQDEAPAGGGTPAKAFGDRRTWLVVAVIVGGVAALAAAYVVVGRRGERKKNLRS
jgi:hypothetical protein